MYVAEVISCRADYYWSVGHIGDFFEIIDDCIYEQGKNHKKFFKISEYVADNTIVDKNKCKVHVEKGYLDLTDIKIHHARSFKIKKLRDGIR